MFLSLNFVCCVAQGSAHFRFMLDFMLGDVKEFLVDFRINLIF